MYRNYKSKADFYVVYIIEAHSTDGWQLDSNLTEGVLIAKAASFEERHQAASSCALGLKLSIPILVDTMDNRAENTFSAWPERLYVLSRDGVVAYQGGKGPYQFSPDELDQ